MKHSTVRSINIRSLLLALMKKPASRTELSQRLGLDQSTMTRLVNELLVNSLVVEGLDQDVARGRPPRTVALNPNARRAIGVHIGTETVGTGLVEFDGSVSYRTIDWHYGNVNTLVSKLASQLKQAFEFEKSTRSSYSQLLGVGVTTSAWIGEYLSQDSQYPTRESVGEKLVELLPILEGHVVRVESNARGFAYGDCLYNFEIEQPNFLHLFVGNVCEVAQVVDGRVVGNSGLKSGSLDSLGMISASQCIPFEDLTSDKAVMRKAEEIGFNGPLEQILNGAETNAELAHILEERAYHVGRAAGLLAQLFAVDLVVVSGGVVASESYTPHIERGASSVTKVEGQPQISTLVGLNQHLIPAAGASLFSSFLMGHAI